jgi:hypothetical protein
VSARRFTPASSFSRARASYRISLADMDLGTS